MSSRTICSFSRFAPLIGPLSSWQIFFIGNPVNQYLTSPNLLRHMFSFSKQCKISFFSHNYSFIAKYLSQFSSTYLQFFLNHFLSLNCKAWIYWIASSIISICDIFPDCSRSGNIFFSFSMSAWLIAVVSTSTVPIFSTIVEEYFKIDEDVFNSEKYHWLTTVTDSRNQNSFFYFNKGSTQPSDAPPLMLWITQVSPRHGGALQWISDDRETIFLVKI